MTHNKKLLKKYVRHKINASHGYSTTNPFSIRPNSSTSLYGKFSLLAYVSNTIFIHVLLIIIMCIDLHVWDTCPNVVIYRMSPTYLYVSYIICTCKQCSFIGICKGNYFNMYMH